jgi:uncharacterized protein YciI
MTDQQAHHLLIWEYVENMLERRVPYRPAHLERIYAEREQGRIVMAGALGDPPSAGAIAFRGVEPAWIEEFVRTDPYVQAGLVTSWRIEPWHVV